MIETGARPQGRIVLLGPQPGFAQVASVLDDLGVRGRVALITAGWQENESEDEALSTALGRDTVNLALHARSEQAYACDDDFCRAAVARQKHLHHLQEFYRLRLDAIDEADRAIAVRHVEEPLLAAEREISIGQLRHIDGDHLARCRTVRAEFDALWRPWERPAIAKHRDEVARLVEDSAAIVVAGGHVMSLMNRLRLFGAFRAVGARPIVAWSAGAMAMTDRIVLFHDFPPFGKNLAQMVDTGMGYCPGIVAMPDASRRVHVSATRGISRFARRMAPAMCLTLDPGERVVFERGHMIERTCHRLTFEGHVVQQGAA